MAQLKDLLVLGNTNLLGAVNVQGNITASKLIGDGSGLTNISPDAISGQLSEDLIPNHASSSADYGSGNSSKYGHVKLSDATDGTAAAASGGTAATPKAVAAAYSLAQQGVTLGNSAATEIAALKTTVGNKADTSSLNSAVSTINGSISSLTNTVNAKVDTSTYNTGIGSINSNIASINTALGGKLNKTTYEYNTEIAFGSNGKLCIGKFPMYDSNITITIKSTTSDTYYGVLMLATQNVKADQAGVYTAVVYGDASNTLTDKIKIRRPANSNVFEIYCDFPGWSKNLLHIQATSLPSAPSDIATNVEAIPTDATIAPTNALKTKFDTFATSSSLQSAVDTLNSTIVASQPGLGTGSAAGIVKLYKAAECTGFTSDDGALTPAAVRKSTENLIWSMNIGNTSSAQSGQPRLQWKQIKTSKPFMGFSADQSDGTFTICAIHQAGSTDTYKDGLAIGGGSGNLFWKGERVAVASTQWAASSITQGTFAGAVAAKADSQAPGTMLLRNTKLVSVTASDADKKPGNVGEIVWQYE